MAGDVIDRVAASAAIEQDETVRAALRVNQVTGKAAQVWFTDLDPSTLPAWSARGGAQVPDTAGGGMPMGFVLAITDRRLVALKRSVFGSIGEIVGEWPLEGLTVDAVDRGQTARVRRFVLGLSTTTVLVVDAPINGDAERLADAFVAAI